MVAVIDVDWSIFPDGHRPGTTEGTEWTNFSVWEVNNGLLGLLSSSGERRLVHNDEMDSSDHKVSRTINALPNRQYVTARVSDLTELSDLYQFGYLTNAVPERWWLRKRQTGTFTTLAQTSDMAPTVPAIFEIEADGDRIICRYNDTVIFDYTDASPLTGRRVGVQADGSATSDPGFHAEVLSALVTPLRTPSGYLRTGSGILRPA